MAALGTRIAGPKAAVCISPSAGLLKVHLRACPDGEIGRRNGLEKLSGSRGNALLNPVKVGESPGKSRGNAEPIRTAL
jgi:hypothetical protein